MGVRAEARRQYVGAYRTHRRSLSFCLNPAGTSKRDASTAADEKLLISRVISSSEAGVPPGVNRPVSCGPGQKRPASALPMAEVAEVGVCAWAGPAALHPVATPAAAAWPCPVILVSWGTGMPSRVDRAPGDSAGTNSGWLGSCRQNGKRLGRPVTAALHAAEIRELHRAGVSKSERHPVQTRLELAKGAQGNFRMAARPRSGYTLIS